MQVTCIGARRRLEPDDIRTLLLANRSTLDMSAVQSYFQLFDREGLLHEFLAGLDR